MSEGVHVCCPDSISPGVWEIAVAISARHGFELEADLSKGMQRGSAWYVYMPRLLQRAVECGLDAAEVAEKLFVDGFQEGWYTAIRSFNDNEFRIWLLTAPREL